MDFNNIWFYTLSTSAQVLAALAGLFAVFVVWKIQDFEKILSETRLAVIKLYSYAAANTKDYEPISLGVLYTMPDSKILRKFSELVKIKTNDPSRVGIQSTVRSDTLINYSIDFFTENLYREHINKKSDILGKLKFILIFNFCVISVCIISLAFSNHIFCKETVLFIITATVLFCLYSIGQGIYKITSE
ncbi:MAG: hypothetical protein K9M11_02290 [Candidatus Pacebacteria bacterium]|nr:hypothetical protein [Candidatus Paceibacterota bacterium]